MVESWHSFECTSGEWLSKRVYESEVEALRDDHLWSQKNMHYKGLKLTDTKVKCWDIELWRASAKGTNSGIKNSRYNRALIRRKTLTE